MNYSTILIIPPGYLYNNKLIPTNFSKDISPYSYYIKTLQSNTALENKKNGYTFDIVS